MVGGRVFSKMAWSLGAVHEGCAIRLNFFFVCVCVREGKGREGEVESYIGGRHGQGRMRMLSAAAF